MKKKNCVNALGGLFSFLPHAQQEKQLHEVSMPSAGYSHFYGTVDGFCRTISRCVNALGGLFSFLLGMMFGLGRHFF